MTQKELLYLEDAIKHEQSIITICEYAIDYFKDDNLRIFMQKEMKKHKETSKLLLQLMEDKANE